MFEILIISLFVLLPLLVVWLSTKYAFVDKIGIVVIMYTLGLILGNIGIFPKGFGKIQNSFVDISLGLAIPLILMSIDLAKYRKLLKHTFLALLLGVLALIISLFLAYPIFKKSIPDLNKILGLLTGLYTGGTPNLASLKIALNVSQDIYIIVHTADLIIGAIVLFFVLTFAQRFFNLFLPKFDFVAHNKFHFDTSDDDFEKFNTLKGFFSGGKREFIYPFLVAIAVMLISLAFQSLVNPNYADMTVILSLTTLSIAVSFIKPIQKLKKSFHLGMFFIYIFCLTIASMANIKELFTIKTFDIQLLVLFVVVFSFVIHALLSFIFRVDTDTFLISTVALVYSTPFVPVTADALKNRHVITTGVIVSLVGYIIGNYLGIAISLIL